MAGGKDACCSIERFVSLLVFLLFSRSLMLGRGRRFGYWRQSPGFHCRASYAHRQPGLGLGGGYAVIDGPRFKKCVDIRLSISNAAPNLDDGKVVAAVAVPACEGLFADAEILGSPSASPKGVCVGHVSTPS